MSGQIQLLADPMLSSLPLAQGGKTKALAITSLKRAAVGARDSDGRGIGRLQGLRIRVLVRTVGAEEPAGRHLATSCRRTIAKVLAHAGREGAARHARLRCQGRHGRSSSRNYIRDEMAKYEKIIKDAKIKVE